MLQKTNGIAQMTIAEMHHKFHQITNECNVHECKRSIHVDRLTYLSVRLVPYIHVNPPCVIVGHQMLFKRNPNTRSVLAFEACGKCEVVMTTSYAISIDTMFRRCWPIHFGFNGNWNWKGIFEYHHFVVVVQNACSAFSIFVSYVHWTFTLLHVMHFVVHENTKCQSCAAYFAYNTRKCTQCGLSNCYLICGKWCVCALLLPNIRSNFSFFSEIRSFIAKNPVEVFMADL